MFNLIRTKFSLVGSKFNFVGKRFHSACQTYIPYIYCFVYSNQSLLIVRSWDEHRIYYLPTAYDLHNGDTKWWWSWWCGDLHAHMAKRHKANASSVDLCICGYICCMLGKYVINKRVHESLLNTIREGSFLPTKHYTTRWCVRCFGYRSWSWWKVIKY